MTHDGVLTPGMMELRDSDDILQRCGGPFGGDLVSITQSTDYMHIKMNYPQTSAIWAISQS